jgi:hypothetical protein
LLTSKVLVNVTIGIGELIQSSNASALFVSWGFTSVFIRLIQICRCKDMHFWGAVTVLGKSYQFVSYFEKYSSCSCHTFAAVKIV